MAKGADYSDLANIKTAKQKKQEALENTINEDITAIDEAISSDDEAQMKHIHMMIDGKYDVALFETATNELWIAEVKSGNIQKGQKNASSAVVGLINTAKNDLKTRLNDSNTSLWLNALNAAKVSMSDSNHQKDAVMKLLGQCADDAVDENNSSDSFNVVLSATLFHPMSEHMEATKVGKKHIKIVKEGLFKKVFIMAIQKETFDAVYNFLESEAKDEV